MSESSPDLVPEGCQTCPNRVNPKKRAGESTSILFALICTAMAVGFSFDRKEGQFRPDPPPQVWVLMMMSATCLGVTVPAESVAALAGIISPKS